MDVAVVNGLFVRLAGARDSAPLILLHAFADSGLAFAPLFDTPLVNRHRLIAVDLAGFGALPRQPRIRTMAEHAGTIAGLARTLSLLPPVGLVAHSVASMIAVEAATQIGPNCAGLFSIEGNLIAEDAYFSGRAALFDDPHAFKRSFLDDIWALAQTQIIFRRYFSAATLADPAAMWDLGRDARHRSVGDAPGRAYQGIKPSLYYWSPGSTSAATARWIAESGIGQRQFANSSHWPMIDQPAMTAAAIISFFNHGGDIPL